VRAAGGLALGGGGDLAWWGKAGAGDLVRGASLAGRRRSEQGADARVRACQAWAGAGA
jgi:hypothetical protein